MQGIRAEVERRLRRRISDPLWSALEDLKYVEDVEIDSASIEDLVRIALDMISTVPMVVRNGTADPDEASNRWLQLSGLVADQISRDDEVQAFRQDVVGPELVPWSGLVDWIEAVKSSETGPSGYIRFPEPPDTRIGRASDGHYVASPPIRNLGRAIGRSSEVLLFAGPGDAWVRVVLPVIGGRLDYLRRLSEDLTACGWTKAQAAIFLVTGVTPLIEPIRVRHQDPAIRRGLEFSWAERIVMEIDPTVSPSDVAQRYREARQRAGHSRHRSLGAKHRALATFEPEAGVRNGLSGWEAWNQAHPPWAYGQPSNFRRDLARAKIRFLHPDRLIGQSRINQALDVPDEWAG